MTVGQINRTGEVHFGDASLNVWEEGIADARKAGGWAGEIQWGQQFKREVFARIVQQLNRLGWVCTVPDEMVKRYGAPFARSHRYCRKGDLQAELCVGGRHIELKMWQDVANVENRNGGRYDFNKESRMPYVLRLEMERTRRRIARYLCNVFTDYAMRHDAPRCGPAGVTAAEWVQARTEGSWHYKPELGRCSGAERIYNGRSADGVMIQHGQRVYFETHNGRVGVGVAHYNINNMWWVVSGKYGLTNVGCFQIYTQRPQEPTKRQAERRAKSLQQEMTKAIEVQNFERAAVLRDIIKANAAVGVRRDG